MNHSWLKSLQDSGPGRVERGTSRWIVGVAMIAVAGVLFFSGFMDWGQATRGDYTTTISGTGSVSLRVAGSPERIDDPAGGSAVGTPALLLGIVGAAAGAGFLRTRRRDASAVVAAIAGGLAFVSSIVIANHLTATLRQITQRAFIDVSVGFGLVLACILAAALCGLGVTAFVLERNSINSRPSQEDT